MNHYRVVILTAADPVRTEIEGPQEYCLRQMHTLASGMGFSVVNFDADRAELKHDDGVHGLAVVPVRRVYKSEATWEFDGPADRGVVTDWLHNFLLPYLLWPDSNGKTRNRLIDEAMQALERHGIATIPRDQSVTDSAVHLLMESE